MLFNFITNFIASSIFNGTFAITICLLIANIFKIKLYKINKQLLIKSINTLLLFGATIYLIMWLIEIFAAYYSGGEYEQYTFTRRLFGSYWWAALMLLTRSILLPQVLWFRKLRRSFIATVVIISVWAIASIPIIISELAMRSTNNRLKLPEQLLFYGLILAVVYLVSNRKKAPATLA